MRWLGFAFVALFLAGCAAGPTVVVVHTDPPGGNVQLADTEQVVPDGSRLTLQPGEYRFTASADGYRPRTTEAQVLRDQEQRLMLPLGAGFAAVQLQATPPEADILVNGEWAGRGSVHRELDAGAYAVEIVLDGYQSQHDEINVDPGIFVERSYLLDPVEEEPLRPTHGRVHVMPSPGTARVHFRGRELGAGPRDLGALLPGEYRVSGIAPLSAYQRLTGERAFTVQAGQDTRLELRLDRRERQFEGEWLPDAEALRREEARYRQQRVDRPFAVELSLDARALETLRQRDDLDDALLALLRVGDRVIFRTQGEEWRVWKRHAQSTPEFESVLAALRAGENDTQAWADDPVRVLRTEPGADPLSAVAVALHAGRSPTPHVHLLAPHLTMDNLQAWRHRADGPLTLIVRGGSAPRMPGATPLKTFGALHLALIPAGTEPVALAWDTRPDEILLVGDRAAAVRVPDTPAPLLLEQRESVTLATGVEIPRLLRLSAGPDFEGWHRESFDTTGPLGFQMDLSQDEIGPHRTAGAYERIWVVEFIEGGQRSQRQVHLRYRVITDARDAGPEEFIRRTD